jgi:DNA-binding MarR family transcriptional regulator
VTRKNGPADEAADFTSNLVVEVFRLNGALLAEGDRLTRDLGLSSARWQVLGALELAERSLTVSQISRSMGLARQSVQRIVNELSESGFVTLEDNPDHLRAKLVVPTAAGRRAFREAMKRQAKWAKELLASSGLRPARVHDAGEIIRRLRLSLMERKA